MSRATAQRRWTLTRLLEDLQQPQVRLGAPVVAEKYTLCCTGIDCCLPQVTPVAQRHAPQERSLIRNFTDENCKLLSGAEGGDSEDDAESNRPDDEEDLEISD